LNERTNVESSKTRQHQEAEHVVPARRVAGPGEIAVQGQYAFSNAAAKWRNDA
jgi:hypothetical protein